MSWFDKVFEKDGLGNVLRAPMGVAQVYEPEVVKSPEHQVMAVAEDQGRTPVISPEEARKLVEKNMSGMSKSGGRR